MKKLLLMKNNFFFNKKPQRNLIAFLVLFCGLFANTITAQTSYFWVGGTSTDWNTDTNWSPVGVPGGNSGDSVTISSGVGPTIAADSGSRTIAKLTITNDATNLAGSTLTIGSNSSLVVTGITPPVTLNGGNIVNDGTLSVNTTGTGTALGIVCGNPASPPASGPYNYGYTGSASSFLNVAILNSTTAAAACIQINSTNTFSRYNFVLNGSGNSLDYIAELNTQSSAIRTAASASPLTISGTGFTTNRGLLVVSAGANVTVESGTTITSTLPATYAQHGMILLNNSTFTNKGTINMTGFTNGHGIQITGVISGNTAILDNQGTIDVNIASSTASRAALGIQNGATIGTVSITNSGIMNLKNTYAFAAGKGSAFMVVANANSPVVNFTNTGSLNFSGTNVNLGIITATTTLTNNGSITSNQEFSTMTVLNNSGKTIAFVKDASTIVSTNALTTTLTFATNNGIIQTATGSTQLNNLAGVAALSSTSSIEPGGATGKGIASFSAASFPLLGTLKLQVDGNTAAGTDYDQVNNVFTDGGFDVSGATLDVTGISGIATPVDIILANGAGTITGTFASVIGLTTGWSVNYSVAGKVQLVYSALGVNDSEFNQNSVSVYKNNGTLYVSSRTAAIKNIKVYDLLGRMIVEQKELKANTASINNLKAINQVLIVKILGEDNSQVTKKVMF